MALTQKKVSNFASARGAPSHATNWDKIEWDFDAKHLKVLMLVASTGNLEVSLNGSDVHMSLEPPAANQNTLIYDFPSIGISRIFVRGTTANIELYAFGVN